MTFQQILEWNVSGITEQKRIPDNSCKQGLGLLVHAQLVDGSAPKPLIASVSAVVMQVNCVFASAFFPG